MIKIQSKLALGLIGCIFGELIIMLSNRLFLKFGLVQTSLSSMALQVVKQRKWIPLTTKRDRCLSYGISTFFCTSGALLITYFLSFSKRFHIFKGFILGTVGGIIPYIFKRFRMIKDFKNPLSKVMCLMSHGFFGLTVALVVETLGDHNNKG